MKTSARASKTTRLALDAEMTVYSARSDRDRLVAALESSASLTVDLSGVAEIDTAGIQLLLALKAECARRGRELSLVSHSPAVVAALDRYNLSGVFGDPLLLAPEQRA